MVTAPEYKPPTPAEMAVRQNEVDALRLLLAQRRLYRRAKRYLGVRWLGLVIIGVGAPVVAVLNPDLAVAAGGLAGVWLFLGRTWLLSIQTTLTSRAAATQELFDHLVFGMPQSVIRSGAPTLEQVSAMAGPDAELRAAAKSERLLGWYPFEGSDGTVAVAIAQRANAAYTDSLLRTTAIVSVAVIAVWIVALLLVSVIADLTTAEFLLGVVFPVLPGFLDVVQHVASVRRSATEKGDLASAIEARVSAHPNSLRPQDLLVWQENLFSLRRGAPDVPDLIYKFKRDKNEQAMNSAAEQLVARARRSS